MALEVHPSSLDFCATCSLLHILAGATTGYDGYGEPGLAGNAPVGTGPGVTGRRGPVRAVEDAIAGTGPGVGTTGGGLTGGLTGGRRNAGLGTGAGVGAGTGAGVGAGTGAGLGGAGTAATTTGLGAGGVRPPMGQRVAGEAEKLAGQVLGNPAMVARGQEKKVRTTENF